MSRLKMMAVWLSRINHCRGFGVQSPSAYAFIRYVVNEHYPYYAYEDLRKQHADVSGVRLKLCRLYLRLANYAQAAQWLWCGEPGSAERSYVNSGCSHTRQSVADADSALPTPDAAQPTVAVIPLSSPDATRRTLAQHFVETADEARRLSETSHSKTMLVVEGIGHDAPAADIWRQLTADSRVSVTFDLYYCGIAFFDSRYKQDYIVNF